MPEPVSAIIVAEYILERQGSMTAMQLHRLCYYSQGWHLAWEGRPLFYDRIEAWANGPVIPTLYELHKGEFRVEPGFFWRRLAQLERDRRRGERLRCIRRALPVVTIAAVLLAGLHRAARCG